MVTVLDTAKQTKPALRHPEKANRPVHARVEKPSWIRVRAPGSKGYLETQKIVKENNLVTVCQEAGCPNIGAVSYTHLTLPTICSV